MNKPTIGKKEDKVEKQLYTDLNNLLANDKDFDTRTQNSKTITEAAYKKVKG